MPPPILVGLLALLSSPLSSSAQLLIPGSAPDAVSNGDVTGTGTGTGIGTGIGTTTATNTLPAPPSQNTVKIFVCGDSITQGVEGDFTWRYRLWEWFRANQLASLSSSSSSSSIIDHLSPALEYVGPYNGTLPDSIGASNLDTTTLATWGAYAPQVDPAFSPGGGSSHFAVYGKPAWLVVDVLQEQVAAYQPDLVVLHLGFNDFAWWTHRAADLLESMQKLVFMARLARRDVKLLIADVSHRLLVPGREDIPGTTDEYNAMLAIKVREWSTPESPVMMVKVSEDYDCHVEACPAGADGLHPNALGDFQIARAYTRVLHEQFLFGSGPLEVPAPADIPGFLAQPAGSMFPPAAAAAGRLASPPAGVFVALSLLCLLAVLVLRPRWLRRRGGGGGGGVSEAKYERLPTTRFSLDRR